MSDLNDKDKAIIPEALGSNNRGNDTVTTDTPLKVTLESINETLINHLRDVIAPSINDNDTVRPVPILYGTPERWVSIRKDGYVRDPQNDKLLAPLIMLRRSSVKQGQLVNPNNKYLYQTVTAQWDSRTSYDKFAVLNGIRPSMRVHNVIIPDYMDLTYDVVMWTEAQSQMDSLIEQINFENFEFWGPRNNFKFQISIEEFQGDSELPATGDRVVRTRYQMTVHAYLLPEKFVQNYKAASTNQNTFTKKKIVVTETVVNNLKNND